MYESFRSDFIDALRWSDKKELSEILMALDKASAQFEFKRKECPINGFETDKIIDRYCKAILLSGLSKETAKEYRFYLNKFSEYLQRPLITASRDDIRRFLYYYQYERGKVLTDRTTNTMLTVIKAFYVWLFEEEMIDKDPARGIHKIKCQKKVKGPIDDFTMERIRRYPKSVRDTALIEVAYSTGCRVNELRTMLLADVDLVNKRIKVAGKGNKERWALLNASAILALKNYLDSRTDDSPYVFVSERAPHNQLQKSGILAVFRRLKEELNLPDFSCHKIRHTTACQLLNRGADISTVADLLGHANLATVQTYAQNSEQRLQQEHWRCIV